MLFVDEEAAGQRLQPIVRHYGERRDDLDRCTENEFRQRTRLNYAAYTELFRLVEPDITPVIPTNNAIPAHTRLQMTLRFMAQGPMYLSNCDIYGVSKASMSRHINSVFAAICSKVIYRLTH